MSEHFNWLNQFILPYANFFLFLSILFYFARKPLNEMIQKRKKVFEENSSSATLAKADALSKFKAIDSRLGNLDAEILKIQENTNYDAQKVTEFILDEARKQISFLKEEAEKITQAEILKATVDLQNEVLEAVRVAVSQRISLDFPKDKREVFISKSLRELDHLSTQQK